MKMYIKILIFGVSLMAIGGITSCKQKSEDPSNEQATAHPDDHGHVHDYACPMHPEMQGHEGEHCNTCGMAFEKTDGSVDAGQFKMEFHASSEAIVSGEQVALFFHPRNLMATQLAVPLDISHEKKIHLFLVNEELTWFDHIHPKYQSDGSYVVEETFPSAGKYILYADFKPSGSASQVEQYLLEVSGDSKEKQTAKKVKAEGSSGPYSISLIPDDGVFYAKREIHFDGVINRNGKSFDANELQNYLGSKGHLIAVHEESKTLVHLHSEIENEKFHFHAVFPEPGLYRLWLQFQAEGKKYTVDFTLLTELYKAD